MGRIDALALFAHGLDMTNDDRKFLQSLAKQVTGDDIDVEAVAQVVWEYGGVDSSGLSVRDLRVAYEGGECNWKEIDTALSFILIVAGTPSVDAEQQSEDDFGVLPYAFSLLMLADSVEQRASYLEDLAQYVVAGMAMRQGVFEPTEVVYLMKRVFSAVPHESRHNRRDSR